MESVLCINFFFLGVCSSPADDPDVFASLCDNRRPEIWPDFTDYGGAGFRCERKREFDVVLIDPNSLCCLKADPSVGIGFGECRFRWIKFETHRLKLFFLPDSKAPKLYLFQAPRALDELAPITYPGATFDRSLPPLPQ